MHEALQPLYLRGYMPMADGSRRGGLGCSYVRGGYVKYLIIKNGALTETDWSHADRCRARRTVLPT
ncbi:hypothetical protein SERLA73DRAFT_132338 [Serpula lacrymans var. lacrymans S7.3]|uniref:Uncharacterized protein n=1 Tax=Serpula lacrymans var. lacrymans (strain S7.3) TaxID=936435 RepID=F8PNS2_SERL3|nr:hypothetical protein SERLA73DRAFT_132338 [Serpula lacrymans var. lacrymans S7.3]